MNYKKAFWIVIAIFLCLGAGILFYFSVSNLINISYERGYNEAINYSNNLLNEYFAFSIQNCEPIKAPYLFQNEYYKVKFYSENCIKQGSNGQ